MPDFIPSLLLKSDENICKLLQWLSRRGSDKISKRILPIINEFRNESLLLLEAQESQIQALNGLTSCGDDRDEEKNPINPITGNSTGFFSSNYKY